MADEDMREMVDAIQEAYLIAKKNNKKYTPEEISQRRAILEVKLSPLYGTVFSLYFIIG